MALKPGRELALAGGRRYLRRTMPEPSIRLFVDAPLRAGEPVALAPPQAHYLFTVMRCTPGSTVLAFNGRDGEWSCRIAPAGRRAGHLLPLAQTRPQRPAPDLWLLFAPLKKSRTDFIVEKATELGVARLIPVFTEFTNAERVRPERLLAHAREAAEQCEGLTVPQIDAARPLAAVLADWPDGRHLAFCDEATVDAPQPAGFGDAPPGPWAILTGPEGGFSAAERARLLALPQVRRIGLGPRVLRADTAAVAALALWQARLGDWQRAT